MKKKILIIDFYSSFILKTYQLANFSPKKNVSVCLLQLRFVSGLMKPKVKRCVYDESRTKTHRRLCTNRGNKNEELTVIGGG